MKSFLVHLYPYLKTEVEIISPSSSAWTIIDMLCTLAFSLIVITSVLGNVLVLWIITGENNLCLFFLLQMALICVQQPTTYTMFCQPTVACGA